MQNTFLYVLLFLYLSRQDNNIQRKKQGETESVSNALSSPRKKERGRNILKVPCPTCSWRGDAFKREWSTGPDPRIDGLSWEANRSSAFPAKISALGALSQ